LLKYSLIKGYRNAPISSTLASPIRDPPTFNYLLTLVLKHLLHKHPALLLSCLKIHQNELSEVLDIVFLLLKRFFSYCILYCVSFRNHCYSLQYNKRHLTINSRYTRRFLSFITRPDSPAKRGSQINKLMAKRKPE